MERRENGRILHIVWMEKKEKKEVLYIGVGFLNCLASTPTMTMPDSSTLISQANIFCGGSGHGHGVP